MTTKYILQRYNKDIEASQVIGSSKENTSSFVKDVPTQEIIPLKKYKLKDLYIKLRLKLETIDLHISKIKREQLVNCLSFLYRLNQRCANSFNVINEEIVSMKKQLRQLRDYQIVPFSESLESSHSRGILKFSRLTQNLNVKQVSRKQSSSQKRKKIPNHSGLNGKYWEFDSSWNRGSPSFTTVNNNRVTRLQRKVMVSYTLNR